MTDWVDLISQNNQQISPQTQATTALTQAQAVGAQLQNQRTAAQLGILQRYLNPTARAAPGQPTGLASPDQQAGMEASGDMAVDAANARQFARQNFAPLPAVWVPQELQQLQLADLSGTPGLRDAVMAAHDKRLESVNGARSYKANQFYTDAFAVANAPEGQALSTLKLLNDPDAQQLASQYEAADLDDDQVRQHAAQLAAIAYQEGRLPVTFKEDGIARDMEGRAIPGYTDAIGLSAQQVADRVKAGEQPVDTYDAEGHSIKTPAWQYAGYHSLQDYVHAATEATSRRSTPMGPGAQLPPDVTPPAPNTSAGGAPAAPAAAPAPRPNLAPAPSRPPVDLTSPNARFAGGKLDFSDADNSPLRGRPAGSLTPGENKYQADAIDTNKQAAQNVSSAQFAMMEGRNILAVLPQAAVGPGTAAFAKLQTSLQGIFRSPTVMSELLGDAGARQMLEKLLGQDAIANTEKEMKDSGGGQVRGGAQLMNLAMQKLNASPEMARSAIQGITHYTMNQAAYEAQKWGPDFGRYRGAGKDVTDFDRWYSSKYDKSQVVPPVVAQPQPTRPGQQTSGALAMPNAALNKGRSITLQSGQRLLSDGANWTPVSGGASGSF